MSDTYESALTLLKPEEVNYDPAQFGELCDGYLFGKFKNYRLKKKLGEGGMGQTWLAEELVENEVSQRVVLKILTQELRGNENALKEVRRIFDLTKNLNHSSICPLLGRYVDPNFGDFLVMKYADGGTLADWFKAQPGHENGLPLETLLPIFGPLAAALDLAHRNGILHRDVKPQNIMFMGKTPVLIDFGIAARIRPEDVTSHTQSFSRTDMMASSTSGTPRYMAPEQMEGTRQNARTDQYALATVLYEMLTGSLPFSGNVVAISRQKLLFKPQSLQFAPHVNAALTRALSFEPNDRFESCVEFLNALKAPPSFSKPTSQVQSKSNAPLWGIAAILVFVLLFCAVFFSRNSETLKEIEPSPSSEVSLIEEQLRVSEAARLKAEADAEASRKAEAAALAKAEKEAQEKAEAEKRAKEAEKKAKEAKKTAKSKPKTSEPDPPPEPPKPAVRKAGERMVKTVDGIEYAFCWCPAGEFLMGSPEDEPGRYDDETQHRVTLTRGFWMLETEVTQAMWESVMGTTLEEQAQKMLHDDTEYDFGSEIGKKTLRDLFGFQRDEDPAKILVGVGSDRPMYYVSWNECEEFCRKLSSKLGLTVSLPTEAQWEYACRAGSETALPNGPIEILGVNNAPALDPIAWYGGNSAQDFTGTSQGNSSSASEMQYPGGPFGVHPVRKKEANAWGLRDMIGNVCEWCQDWYDSDYYAESPTSDPCNLDSSSGSQRVHRGGGWDYNAQYCRSANRGGDTPDYRDYVLGFRPVLASPVPEE